MIVVREDSINTVLYCHDQGPPAEDVESSMSQVQIKEAFQSPEVLQNCLSFLREYAVDKSARAACAVVPLQAIAYPQACFLCCPATCKA